MHNDLEFDNLPSNFSPEYHFKYLPKEFYNLLLEVRANLTGYTKRDNIYIPMTIFTQMPKDV